MNLVVIDGQGGKMGKAIIEELKREFPEQEILAIGTNSIATSTMLKAGADYGATGENPTIKAAKTADVIFGPVGIVIADSLYGEVTSPMAQAVGSSFAYKILLPVNRCGHFIVGVKELPLSEYVKLSVQHLKEKFLLQSCFKN